MCVLKKWRLVFVLRNCSRRGACWRVKSEIVREYMFKPGERCMNEKLMAKTYVHLFHRSETKYQSCWKTGNNSSVNTRAQDSAVSSERQVNVTNTLKKKTVATYTPDLGKDTECRRLSRSHNGSWPEQYGCFLVSSLISNVMGFCHVHELTHIHLSSAQGILKLLARPVYWQVLSCLVQGRASSGWSQCWKRDNHKICF